MPKNTSPNSVGYRKPKFIFSDDPRNIDSNKFEDFVSKAGSEVIIRTAQNSFMDLDEYVPQEYSTSSRGTYVAFSQTPGGVWGNTSNLFDGTVDVSNDTLAVESGNASSTIPRYIQISGYDFSSIGSGFDLVTLTVKIRHRYFGFNAMNYINIQAYIGSTAIGTAQSLTKSSSLITETITLTGLTISQITNSNFGIRYTALHSTSVFTSQSQISFIDVFVDYIG